MSTKHFIQTPEDVADLVPAALECLVYQNPELFFDKQQKFIFRSIADPDQQIAVLSGGGAGHEPAHAAYVGDGMLSAAISGNIFASPSVSQIVAGISRVAGRGGAILIVKNYTGDVFHFNQAAEKARAALGLDVRVILVGDDVSVGRMRSGKVGRRALAGAVLMHKIIGSLAARPETTLDQCISIAERVNGGLVTVAASLDHVHIVGQPPETARFLDANEIEVGMGIHNEPGVCRVKPQPKLGDLLDQMLRYLTDTEDRDRGYVDFAKAENVVLMVNNLGSLSVLELSAIATHLIRKLGSEGLRPCRVYVGTFMTSLNGPGFSITLLSANNDIISLLDAPTSALGWSFTSAKSTESLIDQRIIESDSTENEVTIVGDTGPRVDPSLFSSIIGQICSSAVAEEPNITRADTIVGDGDCGTTLKRGANAILSHFQACQQSSLLINLLEIARLVEENMDGTSGAIYGLFFNGLASSMRRLVDGREVTLTRGLWACVAGEALKVVQRVTPARAGDRTLMDALEPFVASLNHSTEEALKCAIQGMDRTKGMRPAFGRATYVNEEGWAAVPDPGAMSIVALARGLNSAIR